MINLELYRIFYIVAQCQSITKAAKILNISQPAVTKHIKNLEETLDIILFIRTRKGVVLTNDGKNIFLQVKNAMTTLDNLEKNIEENKELNSGTIRIGVSTSLTRFYLIDYINSFHKLYPNINITINTDPTAAHIKMLQSGLIDIIICKYPEHIDNDLIFSKLGDLEYVFTANNDYSKLLNRKINLEELVKYPILLQNNPSNSYVLANKYFKNNGFYVESNLNIGSSSLLIDFVKIGYGIGFVTKLYVSKELKNNDIKIIDVVPKPPRVAYGIITLKNNILSSSCNKFINYIKEK
ncbi:MAG: LysR family transcriptional regulator [Bacilli bacterium]|nr:LysR family transcriptional regulator [Bacilli bacterium]